MPNRADCQAVQYGDQMICAPCGFTWDTNDPEPPKCRKHINRGIAKIAKFLDAPPVVKKMPATLPEYIAIKMLKAYRTNDRSVAGMRAAYRILLDEMDL